MNQASIDFGPVHGFTPQDAVWNPLLNADTVWDEEDLDSELLSDLAEGMVDNLRKFGINDHVHFNNWKVVGMEAGDDRVDFSGNPAILSQMLTIQERVYKMKTSEKDTFISDRYYNFCEVTSTIPSAKQESLEYAKKSGFDNIGFVDCPSIRLVLDVRKGSGDHSSTEVGKVTMHGIRLRDAPTKHRLAMEIASLIQDACLRTCSMDEPKHIPVEMGGCGAPPLWGDYRNLFLYMKAFKRGTYDRVYGTTTNEAYACVRNFDSGVPTEPVMANRLRQRQDYLWGTFSQHVMVPKQFIRDDMPKPLYKAAGVTSGVYGVERRLVRAKLLLPEKLARVEFDREVRLSSILVGVNHVNTSLRLEKDALFQMRKEYGGALRANSAFQNLLNRKATGSEVPALIKQGFAKVSVGAMEFSIENAKWITEGCKGEIYSLADLPTSEDMYVRSEVTREKTMKVPHLVLHPLWTNSSKSVVTVSKLGLWQISETMEDWAKNKLSKLLEQRERWPEGIPAPDVKPILRENPEWVSDDTLLIGRIFEDMAGRISTSTILLITKDKRLCNQLAQTTGNYVVGLDPLHVAMHLKLDHYDANFQPSLGDIRGMMEDDFFVNRQMREPDRVYVDTGSMEASIMKIHMDESRSLFYKETLEDTWKTQPRGAAIRRRILTPDAVRSRVTICAPNTVVSDNPLFLREPEQRSRGFKPLTSMKKRLKKFFS